MQVSFAFCGCHEVGCWCILLVTVTPIQVLSAPPCSRCVGGVHMDGVPPFYYGWLVDQQINFAREQGFFDVE